MEGRRLDAFQNFHDGLASQTCRQNQFADKVVGHSLANSFRYLNGAIVSLSHGYACLQGFLITHAVQRTAFYHNTYLRHLQIVIQCLDGLLHEVCRVEVHLIVSALVDALPKVLELLLVKVLLPEVRSLWLSCVFGLE